MTIERFDQTQYEWLSNFSATCWIAYQGVAYPTVEHAYQAAKTHDAGWKNSIVRCLYPGQAKRMGQQVPLRVDWEQVKEQVMLDLLRIKFHHPRTMALMLNTGCEDLVEGNNWHDTYWGKCICAEHRGKGLNRLGILLMQVRDELRFM